MVDVSAVDERLSWLESWYRLLFVEVNLLVTPMIEAERFVLVIRC